MPNIPIGVQLWSVHDDCVKDFPATLEAVAKLGYKAVEFAGYHGHSALELRKILDDNGLVCAGTHTGLGTVQGDELKKTAEFMATLGSPFFVVPGVGAEYQGSRDGALKLAEALADASEAAKAFGARVGYHNHMWEFELIEDGSFPMQILAENTPAEVIMQLDTGNAQEGAGDPVAFAKQWENRLATVHLKPFLRDRGTDFQRYFVGEDDSDWNAILDTISPKATQFIIVEQERYPEPNTPLQCIERCLKNLNGLKGDRF